MDQGIDHEDDFLRDHHHLKVEKHKSNNLILLIFLFYSMFMKSKKYFNTRIVDVQANQFKLTMSLFWSILDQHLQILLTRLEDLNFFHLLLHSLIPNFLLHPDFQSQFLIPFDFRFVSFQLALLLKFASWLYLQRNSKGKFHLFLQQKCTIDYYLDWRKLSWLEKYAQWKIRNNMLMEDLHSLEFQLQHPTFWQYDPFLQTISTLHYLKSIK